MSATEHGRARLRAAWEWLRHNDRVSLPLLAAVIGVLAGYGAIAFRFAIDWIQFLFYGSASQQVLSMAVHLEWWHRLLAPALGGLGIGLIIHYLLPGRRPHGVAEVIEACAAHAGRMRLRDGLAAALASAASIGAGASVGREGPVVHLAATMGSWLGQRLGLDRPQLLTLLGCGVASGVAASFNAPIAGVFFALEVVVGHYGLGAFAPVVISAVIGTIIARAEYGDFPAFVVPGAEITSYYELPAFLLLGVTCAVVAVLFISGTLWTGRLARRLPVPTYLRPAVGGLAVGAVAALWPEVIGVGYETTDLALAGGFGLELLLVLIVAKTAASCISLGSGFAGGVFSPSLCIGALTGAAFGLVVTGFAPELGASASAYSLVGMGAMAGAVLGAPISTILIIFELTGDYAMTVAVMVAVAVASLITRQATGGSFFTRQLDARGVDLRSAHERAVTRTIAIGTLMSDRFRCVDADTLVGEIRELLRTAPDYDLYVTAADGTLEGVVTFDRLRALLFDPAPDLSARAGALARTDIDMLVPTDTLDRALDLLETNDVRHLPVVEDRVSCRMVGVLHRRAVLEAYNRALMRQSAVERGDA
jgi:CIC family chloride channel protein